MHTDDQVLAHPVLVHALLCTQIDVPVASHLANGIAHTPCDSLPLAIANVHQELCVLLRRTVSILRG